MPKTTKEQIQNIGKVLNDGQRPLKERFRALFTLRNIGGSDAIECINNSFSDSSILLKHELAYCLGQMQDKEAINVLIQVLEDVKQEPMVRHEAAEALGAIGQTESLEVLTKFISDPVVEVAETCILAVDRIKWLHSEESKIKLDSENPYLSVDPAPPSNITDVNDLRTTLLDENAILFDRYRAMFALRNLSTLDSVIAICEGLRHGSALFKHEIAFVLGQLQHEASVPYLIESLMDDSENEMVRHECAEALGSIATEECMSILNKYLKDNKRVVKESCEIALDMCEYENSPEFNYANTLEKVL